MTRRARRWLAALLVPMSTCTAGAVATGDLRRGEQLYNRCIACHALATDRVGPRHCGLIGRRAGSVPGFDYSAAMKASTLVWDERTLDRFLARPLAVVPGSTMTYDGIAEAGERADLIAYLKSIDRGDACRAAR